MPPFLPLIQPGGRGQLWENRAGAGQIVLGAAIWGQPAGVAVGFVGETSAQLADLYVLPAYRRAGIGSALLAGLEKEIAQADIDRLETLYRADKHTPAFEALLTKQGWTPPQSAHWLFWTRCASGFNPWVTRYRFRPPCELVLWSAVTDRERHTIAERGAAGWYPPDLDPFSRPADAWDPETSVALRRRDEIVGWVLSDREAPNQLQIVVMFADPPLQRLGRGFMLAGEVFQRYCRGSSEADYFYCRVRANNQPMLRWTRRAFEGRMVDEYEERTSEKVLLSQTENPPKQQGEETAL